MRNNSNHHIVLSLILKIFISILYILGCCNKISFCFLENQFLHDSSDYINKEYNFSFFKKEYFYFLSEVSHNFFKNNNPLKYQVHVRIQYSLQDNNFLFFKNSALQGNLYNNFFKNVAFVGFGYNIFDGPIYFSQVEFSPTLYYIKDIGYKSYSKMLVNSSWMYSYQLMNDIYYSQRITTLANFEHIITKLEYALNVPIKKNTVFLKYSYNIILNENKLHSILPNMNKYISMSLIYSL